MPEIQDYLLDSSQLAQLVYDYWIQLLRTDNVEGAEELGEWDSIPDEYKEDFIESMRVNVSDVLKKLNEELEFDDRLDKAFKSGGDNTCYICDRSAVAFHGDVCGSCCVTHMR